MNRHPVFTGLSAKLVGLVYLNRIMVGNWSLFLPVFLKTTQVFDRKSACTRPAKPNGIRSMNPYHRLLVKVRMNSGESSWNKRVVAPDGMPGRHNPQEELRTHV
jgi:hypothetical protein